MSYIYLMFLKISQIIHHVHFIFGYLDVFYHVFDSVSADRLQNLKSHHISTAEI